MPVVSRSPDRDWRRRKRWHPGVGPLGGVTGRSRRGKRSRCGAACGGRTVSGRTFDDALGSGRQKSSPDRCTDHHDGRRRQTRYPFARGDFYCGSAEFSRSRLADRPGTGRSTKRCRALTATAAAPILGAVLQPLLSIPIVGAVVGITLLFGPVILLVVLACPPCAVFNVVSGLIRSIIIDLTPVPAVATVSAARVEAQPAIAPMSTSGAPPVMLRWSPSQVRDQSMRHGPPKPARRVTHRRSGRLTRWPRPRPRS